MSNFQALIRNERYMNKEEKAFLNAICSYGPVAYPSNRRFCEDWGYSLRGMQTIRNRILKKTDYLLVITPATSKSPTVYQINYKALAQNQKAKRDVFLNKPVDKPILGVHQVRVRGASGAPKREVKYNCINTVEIPKSVDNFVDMEVANEHIIIPEILPCDERAHYRSINPQAFEALKTFLIEKEGSPRFIAAQEVLSRYTASEYRLAA
jgi:hypothetical protein